MRTSPYDRLKTDTETQAWWQGVLNDPRLAVIVEAAKHMLEVSPEHPNKLGTASAVEVSSLLYAAHRGGLAAFAMLELLGSDAFAEERVRDEKTRAGANVAPQMAGRRHGSQSQPPPEIRGNG